MGQPWRMLWLYILLTRALFTGVTGLLWAQDRQLEKASNSMCLARCWAFLSYNYSGELTALTHRCSYCYQIKNEPPTRRDDRGGQRSRQVRIKYEYALSP